jgi:hypothetical protein
LEEVGRQLGAGQDLSRAALEGLVAEGCRGHRLSDHQAAAQQMIVVADASPLRYLMVIEAADIMLTPYVTF